jgi:high-affinity Fe2+/Pb2+ permease
MPIRIIVVVILLAVLLAGIGIIRAYRAAATPFKQVDPTHISIDPSRQTAGPGGMKAD